MALNLQLNHADQCATISKTLKDCQRIEINLSNKWKLKTVCHGYSDIQSGPQTKINQMK